MFSRVHSGTDVQGGNWNHCPPLADTLRNLLSIEWVVNTAEVVLRLPYQLPRPLLSFPSYHNVTSGAGFRGKGKQAWWGELIWERGWLRRFNLNSCGASFQVPCSHQIPLFFYCFLFPSEWWNFRVKNDLGLGRSSGPKSLESVQAWVFLWFDFDAYLCHERVQPESGINSWETHPRLDGPRAQWCGSSGSMGIGELSSLMAKRLHSSVMY